MTKILITSALALAFAAGTAMAQPPAAPPPGGAPGARPPGAPGGPGGAARTPVPTDKDGNTLKDDWVKAGRPAERFDAMDTNKDGKLSPAEMQAGRPPRPAAPPAAPAQ